MSVFDAVDFDQHEHVAFFYEKETGLKAIIAIHDTNRGPALGGCRMWPYATEEQAITDVLRLSRGMTYKSAIANLSFGGGKAVIIADPRHQKSPDLFHAFARCVEQFNGSYITAEDVGTSVEDMACIKETTAHVVGIPGGSGDPAPFTALGVFEAIRAAVSYRLGRSSLRGIKVAVQGLGNVGYNLCKNLAEGGAQLIVNDIDPERVERVVNEFKATAVSAENLFSVETEIFSPCAMGAVINDQTLLELKCLMIVGSANNQLASHAHGEILSKMKILYAPDYVVNAGGLINVSHEGPNYNAEAVKRHVRGIHGTLLEVFHKAEELHVSTSQAADLIAEERFKKGVS
ncbi:MAG: Glu/Leu/Phe/Val dehydrogenase [Alphaproteobacteria bacterium]|nr:Glu/Leu/Phe/Val dehydrogenase [Alphaproteobacteria bacterium]